MLRSLILLGTLLAAPLAAAAAQAVAPPFRLRVAAGVAMQRLTRSELGLPGLSGAVGVEFASHRPLGVRVEYQGFLFGAAGYDLVLKDPPDPRQVNHAHALVLAGTWRPASAGRLELSAGPGAYWGETDLGPGTVSSLGAMVGAAFRLSSRVAVEAQYHHGKLGDGRALLPVRLSMRF